MRPVQLEVEIENGRIVSLGPEPLPAKARGVLTLQPAETKRPESGEGQTFDEFIERWAGCLTMPTGEEMAADPRLEYLIRKHVK